MAATLSIHVCYVRVGGVYQHSKVDNTFQHDTMNGRSVVIIITYCADSRRKILYTKREQMFEFINQRA